MIRGDGTMIIGYLLCCKYKLLAKRGGRFKSPDGHMAGVTPGFHFLCKSSQPQQSALW
jgi:hypothetical protein